jgi:hypothetical protein
VPITSDSRDLNTRHTSSDRTSARRLRAFEAKADRDDESGKGARMKSCLSVNAMAVLAAESVTNVVTLGTMLPKLG